MSKYFQPEIECAPREQIRALQDSLLVAQVRHVYENVPFYRAKMEALSLTPADISGRADLHKLPMLSKDDLRDHYPEGVLAVPKSRCARIHSTSGTTGRRVITYYTRHDLELWSDCAARAFVAAGAGVGDVAQIAYGYGLFTGGLGIQDAAEKAGLMVMPMSSGETKRQIQFMQDIGSTVLCCTPSYAAYLGESMHAAGLSPEDIPLRVGIFGAEPWTEEMRRDIEKSLGIKAYDIYGIAELSGPGVAFECSEQHGMHLNEDHFIAEVVDPDTLEVLPEGEKGELVLTSIDKEAFPLLRYRTKDICVLDPTPCPCGRTHVRMCKPMGRSDDMLIIRGINVFPSQIETVLLEQGYPPHYQILVDRVSNSDTLDVNVELPPDRFSDTVRDLTAQEAKLAGAIKSMLGITPKIHLVAPKSIARSEGKAVRVIDKRKLHDN